MRTAISKQRNWRSLCFWPETQETHVLKNTANSELLNLEKVHFLLVTSKRSSQKAAGRGETSYKHRAGLTRSLAALNAQIHMLCRQTPVYPINPSKQSTLSHCI